MPTRPARCRPGPIARLGVLVTLFSCSNPDDGAHAPPGAHVPDATGTDLPGAEAPGATTGPGAVATHEADGVMVKDIALLTGFQDLFTGHLQHGRAVIAADFDLDGRADFYIGNPGDSSFVIRNARGPDGLPRFELVQTLLEDELAWGGAPLDYDNDGDTDIFVTSGGNEGIGFAYLFRNDLRETGALGFTDVTADAGVAGPVPPGYGGPIPVAAGNAAVVDYDRDGDSDIFVSVDVVTPGSYSVDACSEDVGLPSLEALRGRDILWRNDGDGTFTDATEEAGLARSGESTRNSAFLDVDGDGDHDLFVNHVTARNELMLNQLVETGVARFERGNDWFRSLGGDADFPLSSPSSVSEDFNQDGQPDLLVLSKAGASSREPGSPYPAGHALFVSSGGSWANVAEDAGLNVDFHTYRPGTMGSTAGDVNMDGYPDVYLGNGGVDTGTVDQLFLSGREAGAQVTLADATALTDFPAPRALGFVYPEYPYRTHGTVIVDVDNDGRNEIAVINGGPAVGSAREPNRLFSFDFGVPTAPYVTVDLVGDGVTVPLDAIGSRVGVTTSGAGSRTFYQTRSIGHGFSAHVLFRQTFPLPGAEDVRSITVRWTDGVEETYTGPLAFGDHVVITRGRGLSFE